MPHPLAPSAARRTLPTYSPPDTSGLVVRLHEPPPISAEELEGRLTAALLPLAARRARATGALPHLGDELVWDLVGYSNGRIVPFIARAAHRSVLAVWPHFAGLGEAMGEVPVGSSAEVLLTLPREHPVAHFQGAPARLAVEVHEAHRLTLPALSAKATFTRLGKGSTLQAVMARLATEAADERRTVLRGQARAQVLEQVARRLEWAPPYEVIAEEVLRRWWVGEGQVLVRLGVPLDDLTSSRDAWLASEHVKAAAAQAMRVLVCVEGLIRSGAVSSPAADETDAFGRLADSLLEKAKIELA